MTVSVLVKHLGIAAGLTALGSSPLMAQIVDDGPGPVAQGQGELGAQSGALEDIVVTAQRKAERLQDVPIAVNAVTASQLASKGIQGSAR